jgi:hypothetical protein
LAQDKFQALRKAYPGSKLLIVSNTAGTTGDKDYSQAKLLEANTGVTVLRHNNKVCLFCLPFCFLFFDKFPETRVPGGNYALLWRTA